MAAELFREYAWLGQGALVVAVLGFAALLLQLVVERRSPRWGAAARLPLEDGVVVGTEVTR